MSGFIFHVSRCGSTLTAKAIARSDAHVVINQGGPLQRGFWAYWTDDFHKPLEPTPDALRMFRNLVFAIARPRTPEQVRTFVKFISWNTLYMDFVAKAFPEVDSLFLYRDPVEVIASVFRDTTAILVAKETEQAGMLTGLPAGDAQAMSDVAYLAQCYARYFDVALATNQVHIANYTELSPDTFPTILKGGLAFDPPQEDLTTMLEQFQFHSKDDGNKQAFKDDSADKQASISEEDKAEISRICAGYIEKLDAAPHNLFASVL